jgi:hypothetical protein
MTPRRPLRARRSRARSAPGAAASHPTRQRDSNRRTRPQSRRAAAADSTPARSQGALKAKAIDGRGWGWDLRIGAGGCTWRPVPPHLPACQLRRAHARPVWSGPRARARAASSAALRSTTRRASATVAMHSSTAVRATAGSSARAQPHVRALKSCVAALVRPASRTRQSLGDGRTCVSSRVSVWSAVCRGELGGRSWARS